MALCTNCGYDNFIDSTHCDICGEPLDYGEEGAASEITSLPAHFTYQSSAGFMLHKGRPLLVGIVAVLQLIFLLFISPPFFVYLTFLPFYAFIFWTIYHYPSFYPEIYLEEGTFKLVYSKRTFELSYSDIVKLEERDAMFKPLMLRVDVKTLPFVFRVVGASYGSWRYPSFLISSDIANYGFLKKVLSEKTGFRITRELGV